ncbi:MAG: hypothetical protein M3T55_01715 [Pseudomonadota bacterium]|nr:hypothetical protein [Pseudomonadota bacterium]
MLSPASTRVVRDWRRDSRRRESYKPRDGDVVTGAAPKVGTTLTQWIVSPLIFGSPEVGPMIGLIGWLEGGRRLAGERGSASD